MASRGKLVCVVLATSLLALAQSAECRYKLVASHSLFSKGGEYLPTSAAVIMPGQRDPECHLTLAGVMEKVKVPEAGLVLYLYFVCKTGLAVSLRGHSSLEMRNVTVFLQISGCVMRMRELNKLSGVADLKVVSYLKSFPAEDDRDSWVETEVGALDSCVAYTIMADTIPDRLPWILTANRSFSTLVEVDFHSIGLSQLPDKLSERFPNLQALELPHNNFTRPPPFPWAGPLVRLPNGLSRTPKMQSHYSDPFYLDIPPNVFRKTLVLDHNRISDLGDHRFNGTLHRISLRNNSLSSVSELAFAHVRGLQSVDLRVNNLTVLPRRLFRGQNSLRYIGLADNRFSRIDPHTFRDTSRLVKLDLARNNLTAIEPKLFVSLENIRTLRLEGNAIRSLPESAFRLEAVSLREIHLEHNRLTRFPPFVLLMRGLRLIDMSHCRIRLDSILDILDAVGDSALIDSIVGSASTTDIDLTKPPDRTRDIDLSDNQVRRMDVANMTATQAKKLTIILIHFRIILTNNPLHCDCHIIPLLEFVTNCKLNRTFSGDEYFFENWRCETPAEFRGQPLLLVRKESTYCLEEMPGCPSPCLCYRRTHNRRVIVDCRSRKLADLPSVAPLGRLELLLSDNNISTLESRTYLPNVTVLRLSRNSLSEIRLGVLKRMESLEELYVDNNLLTSLPEQIQEMAMAKLDISSNLLQCDCENLWIKKWLVSNKEAVANWNSIVCITEEEIAQDIITLPDDKFVCPEHFSNYKHVLTSSLSSSFALFFALVILGLVYYYKMEIKVVLYIYLNVRPFDRDLKEVDERKEPISALIVYAESVTSWALENILDALEKRNVNTFDVSRDFVPGLSLRENISIAVSGSKRMILVLSSECFKDGLVPLALTFAYEKVLRVRQNYLILVLHELEKKSIKNKEIQKYVNAGRYVRSSDKLFAEKLQYLVRGTRPLETELTHTRKASTNFFSLDRLNSNPGFSYDVFVSYPEKDYQFATGALCKRLETEGYRVCLPDRDFLPGTSKQENILNAIDRSGMMVMVLTNRHRDDEWQLFTLRTAIEKSLKEQVNYVTCVLGKDTDWKSFDVESRAYVGTHVCVMADDPLIWKKLLRAIALLKTRRRKVSSLSTAT